MEEGAHKTIDGPMSIVAVRKLHQSVAGLIGATRWHQFTPQNVPELGEQRIKLILYKVPEHGDMAQNMECTLRIWSVSSEWYIENGALRNDKMIRR